MGSAAGAGLAGAPPAAAGSSPVVEFWKSRQRQNGGAKLLYPIKGAQKKLKQVADVLLAPGAAGSLAAADVMVALDTLRASSMNCYIFEALDTDTLETRASLLTQQFNIADPCTYRIVSAPPSILLPAGAARPPGRSST